MPAAGKQTQIAVSIELHELEQVLAAHEDFLANRRKGKRAVLQMRYLARADLSNRNLSKADLSGSTLNNASLKFTTLSHATLYCCELTGVDGRYANFENADMRGVTLNGSNLSHAKLDHADFRPGRIMRANSGHPESVIDRSTSARGVDFSYCSLSGASFEGADLRDADFSGAIIIATKFKGARLDNACFKGAIIDDVDQAALPAAFLKECVLPPSEEATQAKERLIFQLNAHRNWVETDARLGTCAILDGQDLRPLAAVIGKFKLTAISARGANAAGVDFSCTELQGANFENADLRGASFEGADLRGAKFKGALLYHAKFLGADMRPLRLKNGDMLSCDTTGTELSEEQRSAAIFE